MKASTKELNDFIIDSINQRGDSNNYIILGNISEKTISYILEKFKINLSGYKFILDETSVRHILLRRHGASTNDRLPVSPSDFLFIPFIISEFDSIEMGKTGINGNTKLVFKKQLPDELFYVTIQEIRVRRKSLSCVSFRKRKTR